MNCRTCQYLGRHCGGLEGNPGDELPSIDPMSLSPRELLSIACAIARLGTLFCDLGKVGPSAAVARSDIDEPYIWDTKEE